MRTRFGMRGAVEIAVVAAVVLAGLAVFGLTASKELQRIRSMPITDVSLATVADGTYRRDFTYGKRTHVAVEAVVRDHRLTGLKMLETPGTKHALLAEGVLARVLERQSLAVDVVSGATTTSKAILKAIELALQSGVK